MTATAQRRLRGLEVLLLALWLGLLAGYLEAGRHVNHRWLRGGLIGVGPHVAWMAPLADAMLLGGVGGLLTAGAVVRHRQWRARTVLRVLTFVAWLTVVLSLRMIQRTFWLTTLLLVLGLAVQSTRWLLPRVEEWLALARRSLLPLLMGIPCLAAAVAGLGRWSEQQAIALLPAVAADAPDVILMTWDTVRADHTSVHGYPRDTTPFLVELAAAGVKFEQAWSTAPYTLPSHASLMTGRYAHELSADWATPLDDTAPVLAEVFSERGYLTGGFVANQVYCGYEFGLQRGMTHFEDYRVSWGELFKSSALIRMLANAPESTGARLALPGLRWLVGYRQYLGRKQAEDINAAFLSWLDDQVAEPRRPYFAFLNYFDAHHPYLPPEPYENRYGPGGPWGPRPGRCADFPHGAQNLLPGTIRCEVDAYDGAIAYQDAQLRQLVAALKLRGRWDRTILIVTSDHGEHFGEHQLFLHGNSLYRPLLEVPLVVAAPGRLPRSVSIRHPVSLRDVAATVLELAGVEGGRLPGQSLLPLVRDPIGLLPRTPGVSLLLSRVTRLANADASYPVSTGDLDSLVEHGWHYIRSSAGREELYALSTDPEEQQNLAEAADAAPRLEHLRSELARGLASRSASANSPPKTALPESVRRP